MPSLAFHYALKSLTSYRMIPHKELLQMVITSHRRHVIQPVLPIPQSQVNSRTHCKEDVYFKLPLSSSAIIALQVAKYTPNFQLPFPAT